MTRKVEAKLLPPRFYLHQRFEYKDGSLWWRKREGDNREVNSWNAKHAGKKAGSYDWKGYVVIRLDGKTYKAHRLTWIMLADHILEPEYDIDHIDNNPKNNLIENLRRVTPEFNSARSRRKWGTRGVAQPTARYRDE